MPVGDVLHALRAAGMDPDCRRVRRALDALLAVAGKPEAGGQLDVATALRDAPDNIVTKALAGTAAVPRWAAFSATVAALVDDVRRDVTSGAPADYIPILATADPEWFAVSICTVDGQQCSVGDVGVPFSIQSCTKPLMYATAVEDRGLDAVHRTVGYAPSGLSFNEVSLNDARKPHNPYINSGAIATGSLIGPGMDAATKFLHYTRRVARLAGVDRVAFSHAPYLCEHGTAWRNNVRLGRGGGGGGGGGGAPPPHTHRHTHHHLCRHSWRS